MPARKLNLVSKPKVVHRTYVEHRGRKLKVEFYDVVSESPAEILSIDLARHILVSGWSEGFLYSWDNKAVAVFDGEKVVATINWSFADDSTTMVRVHIGGTLESRRRQGFYRVANDAWIKYLQAEYPEVDTIASGYHADNKESAAMQKAFGRKVYGIETRQYLPRVKRKRETQKRERIK